jgi:hypothetical protein
MSRDDRHRPRAVPRSFLALPIVLALVAMSGDVPDSRRVADRFLALFYDDDVGRVREAAQLSTGSAKSRVEADIKFMDGAVPPEGADRLDPTSQLLYQRSTPTEATYMYRVHLRPSETGQLFVRLVLVQEGGRWVVSRFDEKERNS